MWLDILLQQARKCIDNLLIRTLVNVFGLFPHFSPHLGHFSLRNGLNVSKGFQARNMQAAKSDYSLAGQLFAVLLILLIIIIIKKK